MLRSIAERLRDILEEGAFLLDVVSRMDMQHFLNDSTAKRACVRSFEIIGEATKSVPQDIRDLAPAIPWKRMAGMRDRLIHAYYGTDYDLVWTVAAQEIPDLMQRLLVLLERPELQD